MSDSTPPPDLPDGAVRRARDFAAAGIGPARLAALVRRGRLARLGRGLYRVGQAEPGEHHSLALAALRVPHGVVGLLSALRFHGLGDENPAEVWLLLPRHAWAPREGVPRLQIVRASPAALAFGVETHRLEGVAVRVTDPAKTVADAFKYPGRIGRDVALAALRAYLAVALPPQALLAAAQVCRVSRLLRPALEALL